MPNIKSAKKRVKIEKRNNLRNRMVKSELKTVIKKFEAAVSENDKELSNTLYNETVSCLDSATLKGVLHKNSAARKKSNLAKKLNSVMQ